MPNASTEMGNGTSQFPLKRPSFPSLYPSTTPSTPEHAPASPSGKDTQEAATSNERPPTLPSEETSFTQLPVDNGTVDKEEKKTRRRGMVETV